MRQEELAKVFEKKLEALEQIRNAFSEVKRFFAQKKTSAVPDRLCSIRNS